MCGGRLRGTGRDCCLRQPDTVDVFWGSYWTASRRCCSSRVARSLKCDSPPLLRVGQEYITFFTAAVARVLVGKWLGSVGDALWKGHAQPVKTTVFVSFDQQAFVASATTTPLFFVCFPAPPPPLPGTIQANSCSNSARVCGAAWFFFLATVTLLCPPGEDMSTHSTGDTACSVRVGSEAPCCFRNKGPLYEMSELESCVKVDVAVRNSPYCLSGRKATFGLELVWKFLCFMYKFSRIHSGFI